MRINDEIAGVGVEAGVDCVEVEIVAGDDRVVETGVIRVVMVGVDVLSKSLVGPTMS